MSKILVLLQTVHETVHDFALFKSNFILMKKQFNEPKIYSGGVDVLNLKKLSKAEKEIILAKDWYVYYSFRDKATDNLKRMPNIKGIVNRLKTINERIEYLETLRINLKFLLERGFIPNEENNVDELLNNNKKDKKEIAKTEINVAKIIDTTPIFKVQVKSISIKEAFDLALSIKKNSIAKVSYQNLELRIRKFRKSFDEKQPITSIFKKDVIEYLNKVLETSKARNRNNTKTDIASLFQVLEDNEIITDNFVIKINNIPSKPERNKTYKPQMENDIFEYLEKEDKMLLLFIKFISYNFLRPVEVCRLRVIDIDIKDKKLYLKAKNKAVKIKIIPDILINEIPDLNLLNPDSFLFTPNGFGMDWDTEENNKRNYFSKRFKMIVKNKFNLGVDYGLYSFRHTFITKVYRNLRDNNSQQETKNILMGITGHSTMSALEKYLRDIDAELPQDYSHLLESR